MKNWKEILIHVIVWLLMVTAMIPAFSDMYHAGDYTRMANVSITMFCAALIFYAAWFFVWPLTRIRNRRWLALLALLPAAVVYGIVWFVFYRLVYGLLGWQPVINLEEAVVRMPYNVIVLMFVSAAVWGIREAVRRNRENRRLQQENEAMEMDYLRMQFNPHFLFNMLSNLYYCALRESAPLAMHVKRIADMMDYAIKVSNDGLVELRTEIAHIENYAALFRLRFSPDFYARVVTIGNSTELRIPPLLLIPFVENAFKHGEVNNPEHPVVICINVLDRAFEFSVRNKVASHVHKDSTRGVGLPSIKRRLQRVFPGKHTLQAGENNGTYSVNLHIRLT